MPGSFARAHPGRVACPCLCPEPGHFLGGCCGRTAARAPAESRLGWRRAKATTGTIGQGRLVARIAAKRGRHAACGRGRRRLRARRTPSLPGHSSLEQLLAARRIQSAGEVPHVGLWIVEVPGEPAQSRIGVGARLLLALLRRTHPEVHWDCTCPENQAGQSDCGRSCRRDGAWNTEDSWGPRATAAAGIELIPHVCAFHFHHPQFRIFPPSESRQGLRYCATRNSCGLERRPRMWLLGPLYGASSLRGLRLHAPIDPCRPAPSVENTVSGRRVTFPCPQLDSYSTRNEWPGQALFFRESAQMPQTELSEPSPAGGMLRPRDRGWAIHRSRGMVVSVWTATSRS